MTPRHDSQHAQLGDDDTNDRGFAWPDRAMFKAAVDGMLILRNLHDAREITIADVNPALCAMTGYNRDALIGEGPLLLITGDHWRRAARCIADAQAGSGSTGTLTALRRDGSTFDAEFSISVGQNPVTPDGLVVVRDVSERLQAYRLLEKRIDERTHELETLLAVSRSVASTLDLPSLLGLVLDQLKGVVDHSSSAIMIREGDEIVILEARDYRFADPHTGPVPPGFRFPASHANQIWEKLSQREAVIIDDVRGDDPFARAYRATVGSNLMTTFGDVRSYLAIPLVSRERVFGFVRLSWPEPNAFTPRHAELGTAFASQVAIAIENTHMFEAAQQHAAIEERQRLARELHDSVTQSLFSITLFARAAEIGITQAGIDTDNPVAHSIRQLRALTQGALAEMRALIFELRPDALAEEGLVVALQRQAAALTARDGLPIDVQGPDTRLPLALDVEEHLYRLALEALHNTIRHADATHAWVTISSEDQILMEIGDDGRGFDPTLPRPGHLGLTTMADRAKQIAGQLTIQSAPGEGTRTRVVLAGQPAPTGSPQVTGHSTLQGAA